MSIDKINKFAKLHKTAKNKIKHPSLFWLKKHKFNRTSKEYIEVDFLRQFLTGSRHHQWYKTANTFGASRL